MTAADVQDMMSDVDRLLLSRQETVHRCWHGLHVDLIRRGGAVRGGALRVREVRGGAGVVVRSDRSYLPHSIGQDMDNLLVGRRHHALAVDLDDAVSHSDSAPFCDAPPHQAADLWVKPTSEAREKKEATRSRTLPTMPFCTLKPSW